jgi:virulence-associated protein VapD
MEIIKHELVELKFNANPEIVDARGRMVKRYSDLMQLELWNFNENQAQIYNKDKSIHLTFEYQRIGLSVNNSTTENFFIDKSMKYFNDVLKQPFFRGTIYRRLGLRTRYLIPFDGEFDTLLKRYKERYANIMSPLSDILDDEVVDIGAPLVLRGKKGTYNLTCGVMHKAQSRQYFQNQTRELPEVGLYIDIDYFIQEIPNITSKEIVSYSKYFDKTNKENIKRISELLLEDK